VNFMDVSREELEDSYRRAITAVFDAVSPRPDWVLQFASGDTGPVLVRQSRTRVCLWWALRSMAAHRGAAGKQDRGPHRKLVDQALT
jgi:hypothetical protein